MRYQGKPSQIECLINELDLSLLICVYMSCFLFIYLPSTFNEKLCTYKLKSWEFHNHRIMQSEALFHLKHYFAWWYTLLVIFII